MPTNKQRREAARRKLERQLVARQERARRRRQGNVIASIIGAIVIVAVIVGVVVLTHHDKKKSTADATSAATSDSASASASGTPAAKPYPCVFATSGKASRAVTKPTNLQPAKTGTVDATMTTNQGVLTLQLDRAEAPCAVESFLNLTSQKYFDDTTCHRLVTTGIFVLQCGDPTGAGTGGPGYTINDEYTGKEKYTTGVLAMANTGAPDSGGSQFFIVYKDSPLPATYTVFGKVTVGMNVVDKIAAAGATGTTGDGAPKLATKITTMTAPAKA